MQSYTVWSGTQSTLSSTHILDTLTARAHIVTGPRYTTAPLFVSCEPIQSHRLSCDVQDSNELTAFTDAFNTC